MNDAKMEKLLEQGLSGVPPRPEFRVRVLQDSLTALARRRRGRVLWRAAALSTAAVLIAGVSFLLGRVSLARPEPLTAAVPPSTTAAGQTVAVRSDVVAWLEAARLFGQLGMDDRMARAIDRAHELLPYDTATAGATTGPVVAAGRGMGFQFMEHRQDADATARGVVRPASVTSVNPIMAQVLGD
jgi:hypothetical protein